MALVLFGYFTTMVAVLAGLVMLLNAFFGTYRIPDAVPQPHARPAIAQTEEPENTGTKLAQRGPLVVQRPPAVAASQETATAPAPAAALATSEKTKQLKMAREQKRKVFARQRDEQDFMAALGFAEEPSNGPLYNPFGPRRF